MQRLYIKRFWRSFWTLESPNDSHRIRLIYYVEYPINQYASAMTNFSEPLYIGWLSEVYAFRQNVSSQWSTYSKFKFE